MKVHRDAALAVAKAERLVAEAGFRVLKHDGDKVLISVPWNDLGYMFQFSNDASEGAFASVDLPYVAIEGGGTLLDKFLDNVTAAIAQLKEKSS